MSNSRAFINRFLHVLVFGVAPFVITMNAGAQSADRTAQFEKEIEAIKQAAKQTGVCTAHIDC